MTFLHSCRILTGIYAVFALFFMADPVFAQGAPLPKPPVSKVFVPKFFDTAERFERPDLSTLTRLRFLTTVDFPPFNYIDRSGALSGYNIDLMRAICLELQVEHLCQVEAVSWDELGSRLAQGGGEAVIAGFAPTVQNREQFSFSRVYMRFPARFIGLQDLKPTQNFAGFAKTLKIGVVADTTHQKMLDAYFPGFQVKTFKNDRELYKALREQTINVAFGDAMRFSQWLGSTEADHCCKFISGAYYATDYLGEGMRIAVNGKNNVLAPALDYALQALERKGKLAELYLRYFPIGFY